MKVFHEKSLIEINKEKEENGKLKIEFKEGTVTDKAKWKSAYYSYEPEITIKIKIRIRTNSNCIE